jgi:hypothetical protein
MRVMAESVGKGRRIMFVNSTVRRISISILLPMAFSIAVCGSASPVTNLSALDRDTPIIVKTTDRLYIRLLAWDVDAQGNITGAGSFFSSLEDANEAAVGSSFKGTIPAASIVMIDEKGNQTAGSALTFLAVIVSILFAIGIVTLATSGFECSSGR